ncbi:MAG TPA: hypothetical protein DCL61_07675 [Cyanobacteria bacterium UBA12227]|nr:hypothetical protein [Cyanobacteria bacterium UBA12227]HAX88423.1 hypothetical protein [Cyanobacteria bacterium UBA11370]HBY80603.1 hypothetical protein [Cyanobacteria bacterium UBA11148]
MPSSKPLSIFISHPSEFLTNCQPHGDGLAAFEFIHRLAQRGHTLHVAVPSMDIKDELPSNIKLYPANVWTQFSTLNSIEYMIRVRQIFSHVYRHDGVDVIHQLNPVNPGLSFLLVNTGLPMVLGLFLPGWPDNSEPPRFKTSFLGAISSAFTHPLIRECDRQQQKKAAALLLSTPAALTRLYEPDTCLDKIHYLPYGIDTTHFSPSQALNSPSNSELNILYLASLSYRKGVFTLLDAFEEVVQTFPSCRLTIAGTGTELEQIKQRISAMSCQSQITLLGAVARDCIPEVMRQCSVYCLPSYGEPFGISVLEAMACGKPIVGTDAGGLAYLIPDRGGRKVPPRDASGLAKALIEVLSSRDLQMKMGQYNRRLVEERYNWERVIATLESIYYSVKVSGNS